MAKGSGIGGFRGGWLEHPRQWLGAQWPGLSPWMSRAARSRQAPPEEPRPKEAQEPSRGTSTSLPRVQSTHTEPGGTVAFGAKARAPTVTSYWYLRCVLPRWGRLAASALAFAFCSIPAVWPPNVRSTALCSLRV